MPESEDYFMTVVERMPATWRCVDCGGEFDNGPRGEMPVAYRTGPDPKWPCRNIVIGDICAKCNES